MKTTDGAVQGKHGVWSCPVCSVRHDILKFTAFFSVVRCCGHVFDLQNWDNPYPVEVR